jgi:hypothetical protein
LADVGGQDRALAPWIMLVSLRGHHDDQGADPDSVIGRWLNAVTADEDERRKCMEKQSGRSGTMLFLAR